MSARADTWATLATIASELGVSVSAIRHVLHLPGIAIPAHEKPDDGTPRRYDAAAVRALVEAHRGDIDARRQQGVERAAQASPPRPARAPQPPPVTSPPPDRHTTPVPPRTLGPEVLFYRPGRRTVQP